MSAAVLPFLERGVPASVCQTFIHVIKNCRKDDSSLWQFYFLEFIREELLDGGLGGGLLGALFAAAGSLTDGAAVEQDFHGKVLVMVGAGFGDQRVVKALVFFPLGMMTHGIENPYIEYRDSLSDQNADKDQYSLVLANPPFKGSLDAESVSGDLLKVCKTKKTELLFLALFLRIMKIGGRCACIVPDGVLFGSSRAHKSIRKDIVENQRLEAVISMPSGVFKPYAGVSTAILIFTKTEHGGTDQVWFYDMNADGFSLDDKRTPVTENDIPDIIERFKNLDKEAERKRTDQSFMVPKKDIVENDYDLSINKYKEIEYTPVEYPPTSEIMANIRELEMEIGKEMDELERLLGL